MHTHSRLALRSTIAPASFIVAFLSVSALRAADDVLFETHILPILETRCLRCHGEGKTQGGLDLRRKFTMLKGGDSGAGFVAGKPDESVLVQKIDKGEMPPAKEEKLSDRQRDLIRRWVAAGAPLANPKEKPLLETDVSSRVSDEDRRFWSFVPPRRPTVPELKPSKDLIRTPIDAFLAARLQAKGIAFNPEPPREVLVRRATFDLTGLPPTPREIEAALADSSPEWFEHVVDRLLSSPRYGERWGRHWLDLAGYADSDGYLAADRMRPQAWRYRDYVVQAMNDDLPYDRFVVEQLAGDELSDWRKADALTPEMKRQLIATGFLRTALDPTYPGYTEPNEIHQVLSDTMQIVGTTFLGLTLHCARCHSHKFDPVSQKDYFAVQALLLPALDPARWQPSEVRGIVLQTEKEKAAAAARQKPLNEKLAELNKQLKALTSNPNKLPAAQLKIETDKLKAAIAQAQTQLKTETPVLARAIVDLDGKLPEARILRRGDYNKPGAVVAPDVPEVLLKPGAKLAVTPLEKSSGRRLALARWLTEPSHPLTARVQVNRMWAHHFGRGLVPTVANLGRSGAKPTHPELLDWLATEFVRSGWSMKAMHRLMMTSTAYRQSSGVDAAKKAADPDNTLLGSWRPRRLEGEAIRDAVLAVAGRLNDERFGPPVPVAPRGDGSVETNDDLQGNRRSIWLIVRRSQHLTLFDLFDTPMMEVNCPERSVSTVPLQALALMHGPFSERNAAVLADRLMREESDPTRIEVAFRLLFAREPRPTETTKIEKFLAALAREKVDPRSAWIQTALVLLNSNEFVFLH